MNAPRTTYLVLPSGGIVSRRAPCALTLTDYRNDSTGWALAGSVSAHAGLLVWLNAPPSVRDRIRSLEPIRPPLVVCLPDEVAT